MHITDNDNMMQIRLVRVSKRNLVICIFLYFKRKSSAFIYRYNSSDFNFVFYYY